MTGSYNNFFKIFDRQSKREVMLEASKEIAKPRTALKPRKVKKLLMALLFSFLCPFFCLISSFSWFSSLPICSTGLP